MPESLSASLVFLFTDIEGSTRLWEQEPEAMSDALTWHDLTLRNAVLSNAGTLFKTVGDGICAAFLAGRDALAAAFKAQQLFCSGNCTMHVRMALHAGPAQCRDGDYFGPTLNRLARVLAAGHGGQILLTQAAQEQVGPDLPEGVSLRDLGFRQLKDLQQQEHIYTLLHRDLPSEFPPLRSLDSHPNNLPAQLTSFVGREREMQQVREALSSSRLVTLTGVGGCGKTRLALQTAADVLERYEDGVWFVELAPMNDGSLIPQAIASALRVREEASRSVLSTLVDYLQSRSLLLLLDNCEHLIEASAQVVEGVLRACPQLKVLATSREALGVPGEAPLQVRSLGLPPAAETRGEPGPAGAAVSESVQLFMERATTLKRDCSFSGRSLAAVEQICRRLDGIPLAIELAAARVRSLSVEQIAGRLDDRFRLLTGGSRTALPRQQTLQAAIDWSYQLLSPEEQTLLRRLSVFAGGWTLEAAEEVCPDLPEDSPAPASIASSDMLDLLDHLVDKSLVSCEEGGDGEVRYRFLETIRQYAQERLLESGEGDRVRERHCSYFLGFVREAEPELTGAKQSVWLQRLATEYDNLGASLAWSADHRPEKCLLIAGALDIFWQVHAHYEEGLHWLETALSNAGSGDSYARARAIGARGSIAHRMGHISEAKIFRRESLRLFREIGNVRHMAFQTHGLGALALESGELDEAGSFFRESLRLWQEVPERALPSWPLGGLGEVARVRGDLDEAARLYEKTLSLSRTTGDQENTLYMLCNLGAIRQTCGDYETAECLYAEALEISVDLHHKPGLVLALEGIAAARGSLGDRRTEAGLLGAAEELAASFGCVYPPAERTHRERVLEELRGAVSSEALDAAWAAGRRMNLDQAVHTALRCAAEPAPRADHHD